MLPPPHLLQSVFPSHGADTGVYKAPKCRLESGGKEQRARQLEVGRSDSGNRDSFSYNF